MLTGGRAAIPEAGAVKGFVIARARGRPRAELPDASLVPPTAVAAVGVARVHRRVELATRREGPIAKRVGGVAARPHSPLVEYPPLLVGFAIPAQRDVCAEPARAALTQPMKKLREEGDYGYAWRRRRARLEARRRQHRVLPAVTRRLLGAHGRRGPWRRLASGCHSCRVRAFPSASS